MTKAVLAVLVFCAVCVNSDYGSGKDYVRIKRAKYYSNPPQRFYRRPPIPHPVKGIFSYTPPPNYMENDDPYPGIYKPKVSSKRPTNTGLEDEDISNIVKHLSKQDLDKIINFAGEKYRGPPFEKYSTTLNKLPADETGDINAYKSSIRELNDEQKFLLNGEYGYNKQKNYEMDFRDNSRPPGNDAFKHVIELENLPFKGPLQNGYDGGNNQFNGQNALNHNSPPFRPSPPDWTEVPLSPAESMNKHQFSFVESYIQQDLYSSASQRPAAFKFTESDSWKEEQLPKPLNLREQEYQLASTNNVANVLKPSSYQVESFGDLPLMEYSSKRDTVSSYHVPHYSVVSPSMHYASPPSPSHVARPSAPLLVSSPSAAAIKVPEIEPAPPASAAKEQSDAHLKATNIWTHQSKGTAYTLHDDGSLSLEKPLRTKPVYGQ